MALAGGVFVWLVVVKLGTLPSIAAGSRRWKLSAAYRLSQSPDLSCQIHQPESMECRDRSDVNDDALLWYRVLNLSFFLPVFDGEWLGNDVEASKWLE